MASSTVCEIVTPPVLQGASLVWKTIFSVFQKKLKCGHKCCSAISLDVDISSEVQHLVYYFKIQYLFIYIYIYIYIYILFFDSFVLYSISQPYMNSA
jgi:hypothetical protein